MVKLCLSLLGILLLVNAQAQEILNKKDSLFQLSDKFYGHVSKLIDETEEKLTLKTAKYLSRLQRQELYLKRKIAKIDSLAAENIFTQSISEYDDLKKRFNDKKQKLQTKASTYLPFLDTLKTSFKFLEQHQKLTGDIKNKSKEISEILEKAQGLDEKLKQAENITVFINERKQLLKEKLLSLGLAKEGLKYQKEAYYYAKQVQEYKAIINQPDMLIEKSISLLTKVPLFREFMSKYSDLAMLFPMPSSGSLANPGNALQMQGLQTRMQVQNLVQSNFGGSGPNSQQMMQQGVQSARQQLDLLKNKINQSGGSSSDLEMPEGFNPNNQRSQSFWKRLEWGVNLQSTRSTVYWPITTDFGTSVGYKINDRSIVGVGFALKMGWGQDIKHIVITGQGAGIRSFIDWKVKGKIFITGGAEFNYRSEIKNISTLKDYSAWQRSALLGLTMKYSVGKKWKGNIQILYDVLWKEQIPRTQPVLFRTGYSF